jgi:hypothetical protein
MMIPLGPFAPDKSGFEGASSAYVVNAQPVIDGWGPMAGLSVVSAALPAECRGSVLVRTAAGDYAIIAGTATRLYRLNTTSYTWTDISGPSAPYSVPATDSWSFTVFGSKLIAHNITNVIQVYDIELAGTFADLAGTPPKAKYSWVAGDFLVLGYLGGTGGQNTIQWSGNNDITYWKIGERGCDYQVLPEGNEVMGGFVGQGGFGVIQRSAMQFFTFAPASGYVFTRTVINPKQGTLAPRSIVSIGTEKFFYLSEDGFFGGVDRQPIGSERVDRWFLDQVDQSYLPDVQGAADPFEKIVWWKYRAVNGTFRRLGYDWQLDRWCTTDIAVGEMVALATPAMTLEGLDTYYSSLEAVPSSLDSRIFAGGRPTFASFTGDNKLAYFSGPDLKATIDTAEVEMDGNARTYVNEVRVVTDATIGSFTVADGVMGYHGDGITWTIPRSSNRAGIVPFRSDGRLHRFRLVINEGAVWTIASAINANGIPSGEQ